MVEKPIKKAIAEELKELLMQINEGKSVSGMRKQANRILTEVKPGDIAQAEEGLLKTGLTPKRIQQLSSAFILMGLMDRNPSTFRERLSDRHVLAKVLAEHDILRCFVADLEDTALKISQSEYLNDSSSEIRRLAHIVEHIRATEEHIDRESDVIFPALQAQGWSSLVKTAEDDHRTIRSAIGELAGIIEILGQIPFGIFKGRLLSIVKTMGPILKEHLFYEDHILYPVAVSLIQKTEFWDKLRSVCDEIDYCGIHL